MFRLDASSSSAEGVSGKIKIPWNSKELEYQSFLLRDDKNHTCNANKMFFQQSSIAKEPNGIFTYFSTIGQLDITSSNDNISRGSVTDYSKFRDLCLGDIKNTANETMKEENADVALSNSKKDLVVERTVGGHETQSVKSEEIFNVDDNEKTGTVSSSSASNADTNLKSTEENVTTSPKVKEKKLSDCKSHLLMCKEYSKMTRYLKFILKRQKHIPIKNKRERLRRKEVLCQVRKTLAKLRKKLRKSEKIHRFELKRRLQLENRKRVRIHLKKVLRAVYVKRKERIQNMRLLRIKERKRMADNLMLQAAKLRARANRLTAGKESRFLHRKVQLNANPVDQLVIIKTKVNNVDDEEKKKIKKKKHKMSKRDKLKKALDADVKTLGIRAKCLLREFTSFCKKSAKRKARKILNLDAIIKSPDIKKDEKAKPVEHEIDNTEKKKKKKKRRRRKGEAWWRKGNLRAAKKVVKEKPKIDDYGSDTDLYDVEIVSNKSAQPTEPKQHASLKRI